MALIGLMLVSAWCVPAARAQTLRDVLGNYEIPVSPGGPRDLDRTITSYALERAPDLFVIAFYVVGPDPGLLGDTLRVSAWDRTARRWSHASLLRGGVGSILDVHHSAQHVYLDTHSSPSAGRLIVLTRALAPVQRLDGWLLRLVSNRWVIYHKNQVHFAPTHSTELWVYDATTGADRALYPRRPFGPVRRRYVDSTRALFAQVGEGWFRTRNHHMDPERFDSEMIDTLVSDATSAAFIMRFGDARGGPPGTRVIHVMVTCRNIGSGGAQCVERDMDDVVREHPGWTRLQLLNDQLGNPRRALTDSTIRTAVTLEGLIQSRARFQTKVDGPWRYGMLNMTRTPVACFRVLQFVPTLTFSGEVVLDSIKRLEISSMGRMAARDDWTDTTTRAGEAWMPVAPNLIAAAVQRCRKP